MPIHNWTRVDAGTFHDFHTRWITHLNEHLNDGLLPDGYYAMTEQHANKLIADVLTLKPNDGVEAPPDGGDAAVAVASAPPTTTHKLVATPETAYRALRRTIVIRHVSGHHVVALIEIASPGNKDRQTSVTDFVEKAWAAITLGGHLLVVDLFPPGKHDIGGLHGMIWRRYDVVDYQPPPAQPLATAAYHALPLSEAYPACRWR